MLKVHAMEAPPPKKFGTQSSACKVMATFLGLQMDYIDNKPAGISVTGKYYAYVAIKEK